MLGETQGTSAGGADEAGKSLRVPGTNPFFPMPHDLQGNRFLELLEEHPLDVYLMNTGRVGGREDDERSKKVQDQALVRDRQGDRRGDDRVGARPGLRLPGRAPRAGHRRRGHRRPPAAAALRGARAARDEYRALAERFKTERAEFLRKFPSLSDEIVAAVR